MKLIKITSSFTILIILSITLSITFSLHIENKFILQKSKKFSKLSDSPISMQTYNNSNQNPKILVIEVLIESLCPTSISFIKNSFSKFVHTPNSFQLADVIIYPFGNGRETFNNSTSRYEFKCQHYSNECYGNLIQVCAMNLLKSREDANEFLICSYSNIKGHKSDFNINLKFCLEKLKYSQEFEDKIIDCTKSKEGNDLMHFVANRDTKNKFVPWILVNGIYDEVAAQKIQKSLIEYACENSVVDADLKNGICNNVAKRIVDAVDEKIIERSENPFYGK